MILDGDRVGQHQRLCPVCSRANTVDGAPAGLNPHKIVAQIVELLLDPRLPRFSYGHDANNRRNPDGDAQDRQDAAHFIPEQCHKGRSQQRRVIQISSFSLPPTTLGIPT